MTSISQYEYILDDYNRYNHSSLNYVNNDTLNIINTLMQKLGHLNFDLNTHTIITENKSKGKDEKKDFIKRLDNRFKIKQSNESKIKSKESQNIESLRMMLNKVTNDNVKICYDNLCIILDTCLDEEIEKINDIIFQTASKNKFYSEGYSHLYSMLINKYLFVKKYFDIKFNNFIENFDNINYCDSNVDYELFCQYNKENENRTGMSKFYNILCKYNSISKTQITDLIVKIFSLLLMSIDNEMDSSIIHEIIMNITHLYLNTHINIIEYKKINIETTNGYEISIHDIMSNICQNKYEKITSKSVFKIMDLLGI